MPPRTFEGTTVCHKAVPKSKRSRALRVAVPGIIVTFMELQPGDGIHWVAETASGRVTVVKVERPSRRS